MSCLRGKSESFNKTVQVMTLESGVESAGKTNRAEVTRGERVIEPAEFVFEESIIEADIVSDKDTIGKRF